MKIDFTVAIKKIKGFWIGQCLEKDICVQGKTFESTIEIFKCTAQREMDNFASIPHTPESVLRDISKWKTIPILVEYK